MLVPKEVISPGSYWYQDQKTGAPRRLDVTPELTKYWFDQGQKMLATGLQVPVPYEHDFTAHPMTPKEKLLNNAGEVQKYEMRGDALYAMVDVQDPAVKDKIGKSIRWSSPWITSFTDGNGKEWNNVIAHLALTTRPRITRQEPFQSVAAALSMADPVIFNPKGSARGVDFCLSRAGRLVDSDTGLVPQYPMAFSMWSGVAMAFPPPKKKEGDGGSKGKTPPFKKKDEAGEGEDKETEGGVPGKDGTPPDEQGGSGELQMEEILCHLLQALGVPMPDQSNSAEFHKHLYHAAMSKIKELTSKGMGEDQNKTPDQNQPPTQQPNASHPSKNPIIQQEQQPMYMSMEEINRLPPAEKEIALGLISRLGKYAARKQRERGGSGKHGPVKKAGLAERAAFHTARGLSRVKRGIGRIKNKIAGFFKRKSNSSGTVHKGTIIPRGSHSAGGGVAASLSAEENTELQAALLELEQLESELVELGGDPDSDDFDEEEDEVEEVEQLEEAPVAMSLEEINLLPDPLKGLALSMYGENQRLRASLSAQESVTNSLRDAKLKEAEAKRLSRIALLAKLSPRLKADLTGMLANPNMALSLGDGGEVVDPMSGTLSMLEKSLSDIPRVLTTDSRALSAHDHPRDDDELSQEQAGEIANSLARMMGAAEENGTS